MIKKIIIYGLLIFLSYGITYSQNIEGKITFKASMEKAINFVKGKKDKDKKKKKIRSHINKHAKDVKVILKFNKQIAEYYALKKMDLTDKKNFNFTHVMAGGENKYYTYNSIMGYKNENFNCYLLGECFLIESKLPKWTLKQDTKIIQGFLCYKAVLKNPRTGKQVLEAWYTPKIPYQYGVMDYFGLPGLILEINKNTFSITAIKVELNPLKKIVIKKPQNIKKVSQKEFKAMTKKAMPDFYKKYK